MKTPLIIALSLFATGVAAQAPRLGPARSSLFSPGIRGDTSRPRPKTSFVAGGAQGAAIGGLVGLGLGELMHLGHAGDGDDPGMQPFFFGAVGLVVGFVVGGSLTDDPGP